MWATREKQPQEANIYVKRISPEFNQSDLQGHFQQFGTVLSCKIEKWPDGTSRGFGYLQFSDGEKANAAIEAANGAELTKVVTDSDGTERTVVCKIEVTSFKKRQERSSEIEQPFTNLYVKNLPTGCNDEILKSLFAKFGDIESVAIQKDPQGVPLDIGFVNFKETAAAHAALKEMDKFSIEEGKVLYVSRFLSKKEKELQQQKPNSDYKMQQKTHNNSNLYVTCLPADLTDEVFKAEFEKIGKVLQVKLVKRDGRAHDGSAVTYVSHGFVLFEKTEDAQKAIMKLSEEYVFGGGKPLKIDFWRSKEDIEAEKKQKEQRDVNIFMNKLMQ